MLSNLLTFERGEDSARGRERQREERECTHHDSCEQTDSFATVGVRNHVSIADGQESDGDKPHGSQKVTGHVLGIMIPKGSNSKNIKTVYLSH